MTLTDFCQDGDVENVVESLKTSNVNEHQGAPLRWACKNGHYKIVIEILQLGGLQKVDI